MADHQVDRFAASYRRSSSGELVLLDDPQTSEYRQPAKFIGGGGGLVSTALDYLRFCEMVRLGGELDGARILAPRTIDLMLQNHLPGGKDIASLDKNLWQERGNVGVGYGLGFATVFDPVQSGTIADHDVYWSGFHSTLFWVDREAGLSVVFMVQFMPPRTYDFRGPLRSLVYSSITE